MRYQAADFEKPGKFIFAGRVVDHKGIEPLMEGYQRYRSVSKNPWPLEIIGAGPLETKVRGQRGVDLKPFKQPP